MKPHLPQVTLVAFDGGTCLELTTLALHHSLAQVSFGEVVVCTPEPIAMPSDARWVKTPRWRSREECQNFQFCELPELVRTDFLLLVHYDAWILDGSLWEDEFLNYDWMGAPWWYDDGFNVGFGAMYSLKLLRFLAANRSRFPLRWPDDDTICRRYRPALEAEGFRWPSEQVASRFMLECTRPSWQSRHFMFHDSFNFPVVLKGERLIERVTLMWENAYLQRSGLKIAEIRAGRMAIVLPRLATV